MNQQEFAPIVPGEDILPEDVEEFRAGLAGQVAIPAIGPSGSEARNRSVPRSGGISTISSGSSSSSESSVEAGDFPSVEKLERWVIQVHTFRKEAAADVSLLGRLFSGSAKAVECGVVHEAKRYTMATVKTTGRRIQYGVTVRLAAATESYESTAELTLPNLAAEAQLNGSDARVGIDVLGYSGPLGEFLPAPTSLNVEAFSTYLAAFEAIQATVFGADGERYLRPTVLSFASVD